MSIKYDPKPNVPVPSAIGDILYSDMTVSSDIESGKTPIAICVGLPESYEDGKARYMSLVNMSATDPENGTTATGNDTINNPGAGFCWGGKGIEVPGITCYTSSTAVLEDKDGKVNTTILWGLATNGKTGTIDKGAFTSADYPAAVACHRFYTQGTQAGDWYLPAAGELQPILPNLNTINTKLGSLGVAVGDNSTYETLGSWLWSSSQKSSSNAWYLYTYKGSVNDRNKNTAGGGSRVRAFFQL